MNIEILKVTEFAIVSAMAFFFVVLIVKDFIDMIRK